MDNKMRAMLILGLCLLLFLSEGCASATSGRMKAPTGAAPVASGLRGKDKETVIRTLGDPDFITTDKGVEYWGYQNRTAWHLNLYYASFGKVEAQDLVMALSGNRVRDAYLVNKGSSLGFIEAPMPVPD